MSAGRGLDLANLFAGINIEHFEKLGMGHKQVAIHGIDAQIVDARVVATNVVAGDDMVLLGGRRANARGGEDKGG